MLVEFKTEGNVTTAFVSGKINTDTAQKFQDCFENVDKSNKLILDFADVEMITSAGLRALVVIRIRFPDDRMEVINVSKAVYDVFEMTGFDDMIPTRRASNKKKISEYVRLSFKDFLKEKVNEDSDRVAMIAGGDAAVAEGAESQAGLSASGGVKYTWSEIDKLSQIIARDLYDRGVRKGTHVGLMGMNSVNWVLTFFAIQKLGAIALLVNFNLKAGEVCGISKVGDITHLCYGDIAEQCEDSEFVAKVTDTENSFIRNTYKMSSDINYKERLEEYSSVEDRFSDEVDPDSPALVIFTSGSTGKPKAVLLSAYNILNSSSMWAEEYRIGAEDKICLVLPTFHIFGLTCGLFGNFIADSLVVIPKNIKTGTIVQTIATEKCTHFYSVPTLLLAIAASKNFKAEYVEALRCVVMGGASATPAQIVELQKQFPNTYFHSAYGLSEMTPVTMCAYQDSVEHVTKTVGKPMKNIEIRISDISNGSVCAQGQSGEVLVKGFNTMVCYYRLDPSDQPLDEEGWLHTGDLGLIDDDGYLRLVGRAKELIIRGGENIAPGEIAEAMTQYPGVADVKVQGIPDDFYGEIVGASVVMKDGKTLDTEDMKKFLVSKLAKYKIPEYIFQYDKLPLLSNGKVDAVGLKKDMNAKAAALRTK